MPAWSPDGRSIVYVADGPDRIGDPIPVADRDDRRRVVRVKGHRHKLEGRGYFAAQPHLWLVPAGGGEARQLTDGDAADTSPAWSPDGRSIAFVSDRSPDRDRHFGGGAVHVLDVATGRVRQVSPEGRSAALPAWSPDGRRIAYLRTEHPLEVDGSVERLWVVTVASRKEACWTASIDRAIGFRPGGYRTPSPPAWAADGRSVIQILSDGGTAQLVRIAEGELTQLTEGRHVVADFVANQSTSRIVFLGTDPITPLELWRWDATTGVDRVRGWNDRLRDLGPTQPRRLSVGRPDVFQIEAWLYVPGAGDGRRQPKTALPLIVVVHGGPHNAYGETWNPEIQLLAGAGYAVLAVNPRGSGGYGEAFARAVVGDWGGADLADILAVLDHVLAGDDPAIDPVRVGMTGGSYGGFMTCWAITQTNRFAAAVAGASITNLESEFGTADIGPSWLRSEQGGAPWERPEAYRARSPLHFAERVRTPLLLYHGEADLRCPIEQSEQFFTALTAHGAEVELLRVPAEGHVLPSDASPVHRRIVREAILDWFGRFLPEHKVGG